MVVIVKLSFQCKTLFKMAKKIWASKYLGNYSIARYTRVALLNIYWQMLALSILQVICCFYNVQVLNFDYLWLILQRVMEGLATHTVWDRIRAIFIPSLSQLFFFFFVLFFSKMVWNAIVHLLSFKDSWIPSLFLLSTVYFCF